MAKSQIVRTLFVLVIAGLVSVLGGCGSNPTSAEIGSAASKIADAASYGLVFIPGVGGIAHAIKMSKREEAIRSQYQLPDSESSKTYRLNGTDLLGSVVNDGWLHATSRNLSEGTYACARSSLRPFDQWCIPNGHFRQEMVSYQRNQQAYVEAASRKRYACRLIVQSGEKLATCNPA